MLSTRAMTALASDTEVRMGDIRAVWSHGQRHGMTGQAFRHLLVPNRLPLWIG